MTVVLVALGSSLFAVAMFLLSKATETPTISWGYMYGMFMSILLAFVVYGCALRREWKREKIQGQERQAREQREIEREKRAEVREKREQARFESTYGGIQLSNKSKDTDSQHEC